MRIAIVSDIHSNLAAFEEVLADIDRVKADRIVSLGDNIGYGPDPEEVLQLVRQRNILSIMGNHELGLVDPSFLSWFNYSARRSLEINSELLSPLSLTSLRTLEATLILHGCLFVHGVPPDSTTRYLFEVSERELLQIFRGVDQELAFVGHTHALQLIACDGRRLRHARLREGPITLEAGWKYLINAGSVGQPRDGDHHAKYLIWDRDARLLEVRFVPYDIARTVHRIRALGLPTINADRLL